MKPAVMIFAREISEPLTSLVKKVNETKGLESFVVFCSDAEGLREKLTDFGKKEKLTTTILTIGPPNGPPAYKVAKEADITVVGYVDQTVQFNHAYKKGQFNQKEVAKIVKEIPSLTK